MDSVVGLDFFQEKKKSKNQKEESAMKVPWKGHKIYINLINILPKIKLKLNLKNKSITKTDFFNNFSNKF